MYPQDFADYKQNYDLDYWVLAVTREQVTSLIYGEASAPILGLIYLPNSWLKKVRQDVSKLITDTLIKSDKPNAAGVTSLF